MFAVGLVAIAAASSAMAGVAMIARELFHEPASRPSVNELPIGPYDLDGELGSDGFLEYQLVDHGERIAAARSNIQGCFDEWADRGGAPTRIGFTLRIIDGRVVDEHQPSDVLSACVEYAVRRVPFPPNQNDLDVAIDINWTGKTWTATTTTGLSSPSAGTTGTWTSTIARVSRCRVLTLGGVGAASA